MVRYIHWWQFPLNLVSFKLEKKFKNELFEKAKRNFKSVNKLALFLQEKSKLYNKNIITDYRIVWQYQKRAKYIPAWVLYEIAKKIKIKLLEIERNIKGYLSTYGRLCIIKPKLPIRITPEFAAIAIHIMCDGSIAGRNFCYFQKEEKSIRRFTKLIFNIFGKYKIEKYKKAHYFPAVFSAIIANYFRISNFLGTKCRIPYKILKGNKDDKIATLLTVLHDEGNTSGNVRWFFSNKKFIKDLKNLAQSLRYKCNISARKIKGKMTRINYCLSLSASSLEKFIKDCDKLISKYPDLYIGRKLDKAKRIIKFKQRNWKQRRKFETKKIILKALNSGPKTALELQEMANINLWTTYHHLQQLIKLGKIEKYKEGPRLFKYKSIP